MKLDKEYDINLVEIVKDLWERDRQGLKKFFWYILWERHRQDLYIKTPKKTFCIILLHFLEYLWITDLPTYQSKILGNYTNQITEYAKKQVITGKKLDKLNFYLRDFLGCIDSKKIDNQQRQKELQEYTHRLFLTHFLDFLQKDYLPF